MTIYNPILILSVIMCIRKLVSISLFILKILNKNRILTEIKGCNFVAKNKVLQSAEGKRMTIEIISLSPRKYGTGPGSILNY